MPYWSEEQTAELVNLLKAGYTYRQISKVLNISKNALIGRVHRIKAEYPAGKKWNAERNKKQKTANRKNSRPKQAPLPEKDIEGFLELLRTRRHVPVDWSHEPPSLKVTFADLEDGQCRYIHGDPKHAGHHFCGHPQHKLGPYCQFHASVCFTAVPKRKVKNARVLAEAI